MDMEEDDEFGDLYTDVLRPISTAPPPIPSPSPPPVLTEPSPAAVPNNSFFKSDEDGGEAPVPPGGSRSGQTPSVTAQTLGPDRKDADGDADWILGPTVIPEGQLKDWNEEDSGVLAGNSSPAVADLPKEDALKTGVVEEEKTAEETVKEGDVGFRDSEMDAEKIGVESGIGDLDSEQVIPGLSVGPVVLGAFHGMNIRDSEASKSDEWDSDSGDDLQIVLNDDAYARPGPDRGAGLGMDDDDEDGEDDLVIVTDNNQHHLHHQGMEGEDWGEDSTQPPLDGEKKDMPDAVKGSTVIGAAGSRAGYGGQGFHSQHHSQFKYIRPGAASIHGAGAPGQARPPLSTPPPAGRGRGLQRGFHSGYGMAPWGNSNSARPHGIGLDFTLSSHKTIFDVDIDSFEEKPWKHPGIDIAEFFNFGLDEDSWKDYCKQLEQLRLEATMQSKIRVYESGRSEQDFDPDLPPELAAATGLQDASSETAHARGMEGRQLDSLAHGRGTSYIRPQLPTGRAIQVEGGYGERLPSIDTRPPRIRDSDAIIEIVPQDLWDDSVPSDGVLKQQSSKCGADSYKMGIREGEENHTLNDHDRFAHARNEKESTNKRMRSVHDNVPEENGITPFPQEGPTRHHSTSQIKSPSGTSHAGRYESGRSHERCSSGSEGYSDNSVSGDSAKMDISDRKVKSEGDIEDNKDSETLPRATTRTATDLDMEEGDEELGERLALAESSDDEREEIESDLEHSGDSHDDDNSVKKKKLSSQGESKTTIIDNTRGKSESSKDFEKRIEGGENEVMQDARSRHLNDFRKKLNDKEDSLQHDHGRGAKHVADRNRVASKVRDDLHYNNLSRGLNSDPAKIIGKAEINERSSSAGPWRRRDDDVPGRRTKGKDIKSEHIEEIGLIHREKIRAVERKGDDHADDGYWKSRRDRIGPSQMGRDEIMMNRHEKIDDIHAKSRKDVERGKESSKDKLHGYRVKEDTNLRRQRDASLEYRRKDELIRAGDKAGDRHAPRNRDESLRPKEREDRQRMKNPHEDMRSHRERDDLCNLGRNNRLLENKPYNGSGRTKDSSKRGIGAEKDSLLLRRPNEHSKRGDRTTEEIHSQQERHKKVQTQKNQSSIGEKNSRNGRLSNHNNRTLNSSGSQHLNREKNRENLGSKETHDEQKLLVPSKRKHDDGHTYRNVKMVSPSNGSLKEDNGEEANNQHHADKKPEVSQEQDIKNDGKLATDEENRESKRGRSKLERWTSHKERDCSSNSIQSLPSSLKAEGNNDNVDVIPQNDPMKNEMNKLNDPDTANAIGVPISDKDGSDRHLETVEKLKKRSERFKLPMPGEDAAVSRKVDNSSSVTSSGTLHSDSDIKHERPARKRRWVGS